MEKGIIVPFRPVTGGWKTETRGTPLLGREIRVIGVPGYLALARVPLSLGRDFRREFLSFLSFSSFSDSSVRREKYLSLLTRSLACLLILDTSESTRVNRNGGVVWKKVWKFHEFANPS